MFPKLFNTFAVETIFTSMGHKIVGRDKEIKMLQDVCESDKSELVAVYGRRRVGKTYLVKEFFNEKFDFYATGIFEGKRKDELAAFCDDLSKNSRKPLPKIRNWMEAFTALRDYLQSLRKKRIIVFLDEFPWFDAPAGQFLKAFEWFWNSWGSTQNNLKLIVCGSSTTWMTDKFINSKGGLYNRTTERIHLAPFNLKESEALLESNGVNWDKSLVLDAYMIFGGVPLYLSMLKGNLSLDANVDKMYFCDGAPLKDEYRFLFRSLFKDSDYYMRIVDAISRKNIGLSRADIVEYARISNNGTLTNALNNLISCDFIRKYSGLGMKERGAIYQLTDLSILFYKRFVENYNGKDERHWSNTIDSPSRRAWTGIAFEQVCLLHVPQIKQALGISGVQTEVCSWRFAGNDDTAGIQIDLLIARRDKTVNLCEMKYSDYEYEITSKYNKELRMRKETFRTITRTRNSIHLTFVTPWGIKKSPNSSIVDQSIVLEQLFSDNF